MLHNNASSMRQERDTRKKKKGIQWRIKKRMIDKPEDEEKRKVIRRLYLQTKITTERGVAHVTLKEV